MGSKDERHLGELENWQKKTASIFTKLGLY